MKTLTPTLIRQGGYRAESRKNTQIIQSFCQALVPALGYRAVMDRELPLVYWLDSRGKLNNLQVRYYSRPFQAGKHTPWIVRIHINHYTVEIPPNCLRVLLGDFPRQRALFPAENQDWQMELSVLPDQLPDTLDWVVQFVHSKDGGEFDPTILPPFPCYWWGGYRQSCQYAWSRQAWRFYNAWTKKQRIRRGD